MKKTDNLRPPGCHGLECHTTLSDDIPPIVSCADGGTDCGEFIMASGEITPHHDQTLEDATQAIQHIINLIGPDEQGRQLSYVYTKYGMLLVWMEHGAQMPAGKKIITQADNEKAFLKALKIKKPKK